MQIKKAQEIFNAATVNLERSGEIRQCDLALKMLKLCDKNGMIPERKVFMGYYGDTIKEVIYLSCLGRDSFGTSAEARLTFEQYLVMGKPEAIQEERSYVPIKARSPYFKKS